MKQYMPMKPTKRVFKISDALNGYFCDLIPYIGATGGSACLGLGEKVMLELTQPLFGRNHQVFVIITSLPSRCFLLSSTTIPMHVVQSELTTTKKLSKQSTY